MIVLGHVVRGPVGGMAWHHLQYVLGLARLGHDVYFLEDSQDHAACYDPDRDAMGTDPGYGLRFASRAFEQLGLGDRWSYWDAHAAAWLGSAADRALELCRTADVLLDMSGKNPARPWFARIPHRVLVDTDPAFTQIRHLQDPGAGRRAWHHTAFFSFGENLANGGSRIPDDRLPWRATRQPIVLEQWPVTKAPATASLTTVLVWDSYAAREHDGIRYGMKSQSFEPYLDLPSRVEHAFVLAAGGPTLPKARLRDHGWQLRDPLATTRTLDDYRSFLQQSWAEFSVAKHGYVVSRSGWFSERSAAYLASGRPVVVQDTGFSSWLPCGEGVLAFDDPEGAVAAIEALAADHPGHCAQARAVAETYFDSDRVLSRLLSEIEGGA